MGIFILNIAFCDIIIDEMERVEMCNKIPYCPNCKHQMVIVWYHEPHEMIDKFMKEKKIFWRGLELKNTDRENPERIIYHCYNCSRSYSKNLIHYIEETSVKYPYKEINDLIEKIATRVIDELSAEDKKKLKIHNQYEHFGIGLYIRNNYIFNNEDIKYRMDADELSLTIYNKVIERLSNNDF